MGKMLLKFTIIVLLFVAGCSTIEHKPIGIKAYNLNDNLTFALLLRITGGNYTPLGRNIIVARYGLDSNSILSDPNLYIPSEDADEDTYFIMLDKFINDLKAEQFRRQLLSAVRQQNRPLYQPYQYNWQQQQLNNQTNQTQCDDFQNDFVFQGQQHDNQVLQNWNRSMNQIQQKRQHQADLYMP